MLDAWGLRVIIGYKRGGALTELILFEGGGDVFKNFLGMFYLFTPLGSARLGSRDRWVGWFVPRSVLRSDMLPLCVSPLLLPLN